MSVKEISSSNNESGDNTQNSLNINNTEADSQEIQTSDSEAETKDFSKNSTKQSKISEIENDFETKDTQENQIEKVLYDEILEKLDIKKKENKQELQDKSIQNKSKGEAYLNKLKQLENIQAENQIKETIRQDLSKIQKLVQIGLINSAQGQNLKKQVLSKAFDKLVQTEKIKRNFTAIQPEIKNTPVLQNKNKAFEEFSQSNPNFFTSEGRKEVLNYLKSGDVIIGKDELNKISEIIRIVEKSAIEGYLKNVSYEKTLRESNDTAKQKLTANAQKSMGSKNLSRTFTREQIGKMSSAEFIKYESEIMAQLKKGLIK